MVVVSLKYVMLVMRADNNGEGGMIAMLALATTAVQRAPALRRVLMLLGLFGAALFYGDGVITPAISVLSRSRAWRWWRRGCKRCGDADHGGGADRRCSRCSASAPAASARLFGPVTLLWFVVLIARSGLPHIVRQPAGAAALDPRYALRLLRRARAGRLPRAGRGGAGASPAARRCTPTWATSASGRSASPGSALVLPALVLNYFGQGALLLRRPERGRQPVLPDGARAGRCCRWWCWPPRPR